MTIKKSMEKWARHQSNVLRDVVGGFVRNEKGGIAAIAGLSLVPLLTLSSMGVELARVSNTQTKIAYAADAAALAAARYDAGDAQANALKFFNANFGDENVEITTDLTVSEDNKTFTLHVNGEIATRFSGFLGIPNVAVDFETTITRDLGGLEVALVLDNSLSMSGSKIESLKTAAKNLIDTLFDGSETSDKVRISLVPYAASVALTSDRDENSHYSEWMRDAWSGSGDWSGCVEVRTVDAYRLDDTPPGSDDETKFYHYNAKKKSFFLDSNNSCPLGIMSLTNEASVLKAHLDKTSLAFYTAGPLGLVWGWRTLSPRWQGKWVGIDPRDYEAADNRKVIVMMTDGENNANPTGLLAYTAYYSIGSAPRSLLDSELSQICTNIKAQNIEIFTITFKLDDEDTKTLYRQCASKEENYYDATTDAGLESVFEEIATTLKTIRIKS